MVMRNVSNVRSGKVTTCPGEVREVPSSATATGSSPSKVSVTSLIQRFLSPGFWSRVTRSVVTGSSVVMTRYSPVGSSKAPTFQPVDSSPSTAFVARSPGV